ncbi:MAG: alpha-mannosidase [Promethearchaeati archaeon]
MDKKQLLKKLGHYSGNRRLDVSNCQEPRFDDEETKIKWIEGEREVRIKRKLKRWRNNILKTIKPKNLTIHLVGQSHIDCAWMWRYEQTRKKSQVTFSKAIFHSNIFPNKFLFALSQPILLEWIKEDNPELFHKIQEKVNNKNIELVGGSYVEPDCMMPSGEAMIRQRLYGMRFYKKYFKKLPKVEWFLDSFGFNYGLPQILAKSGAKYFWTSKMTWNRETTFPFVHFWWKGADGTQLLAANFHYDPQVLETWEEYEIGRHLLKPNGKKEWKYSDDYSLLKNHVQENEICPHVGFFFGQSDGGHGPTHREVAEANKLSELTWFKWSRVENFFKELEYYSDDFPVWNDELYLEFHRGCFSNHGQVKRYNRKYENLLPSLEKLAVLISLMFPDYKYPQKEIENLWKITLKNQFHDVLPGSSIPEVYDDCWEDWNIQNSMVNEVISKLGKLYSTEQSQRINNPSKKVILFNSLSWNRTARVFIPIDIFDEKIKFDDKEKPPYAKFIILNENKKEYICQPVSAEDPNTIDPKPAGWWMVLEIEKLSIIPGEIQLIQDQEIHKIYGTSKSQLEASSTTLKNGDINLEIDPSTGALLKLSSRKINSKKNLIKGDSSNLTFGFFDDVPIQYHAWNLTPEYWNQPIELSNEKNVEIILSENGPIFNTIQIKRKLGKNPVIQKLTLFKDSPLLYLDYMADWNQKNIMLKVKYSPNLAAEEVIADGMYCAVSAKMNPETPCDKARFEKICHKYFDVSTPEKSWGMALINEDKYAFDVRDGDMNLTMLRACKYPETAPEAWVNKERELNEKYFSHRVPEYSGLGPFSCRYALFPHKGSALKNSDGSPNVVVNQKAEEFNNPIMVIHVEKNINLDNKIFKRDISIELTPENVFLKVMKEEEWDQDNSIILRFHEVCGISSKTKVKFGNIITQKFSSISSIDLLERTVEKEYIWDEIKKVLKFEIGKFEIVSFKLTI